MTGQSERATYKEVESANSTSIRLSIALVTRNRPKSLERCLSSWSGQTVRPFEIVVSDDSDKEYSELTRDIAVKYGCRYTSGPRRGLYANRNHAALSCSGSHIMTGDDDHTHPCDYVEKVLALVVKDPERIWTFSEYSESYPAEPGNALLCPPELHPSGHGRTPCDPSNSAGVADGSTVYPRIVFDSGLRYDETYKFGTLWYLWGLTLKKNHFRITFSTDTQVFHHDLDLVDDRFYNKRSLAAQLECMSYVTFVDAIWINPSLKNFFLAWAYLVRRMIFSDSIILFKVKARVAPWSALRLLYLAFTYPLRQRKAIARECVSA